MHRAINHWSFTNVTIYRRKKGNQNYRDTQRKPKRVKS